MVSDTDHDKPETGAASAASASVSEAGLPEQQASAAATALAQKGVDAWLPFPDPATGRMLRRTLLMRAAQEGSLDLLRLLLQAGASVNSISKDDGLTPLHAAASCANAASALEAIKLLLEAGADRERRDHAGCRPLDVFITKGLGAANEALVQGATQISEPVRNVDAAAPAQPGSFNTGDAAGTRSPSSEPPAQLPEVACSQPLLLSQPNNIAVRETVDIQSADFRMYQFKVEDCPFTDMLQDHDWTECPYAHPGEKARRRDPRKYNYTSTTCPDFRKGSCKRGDACPFAHGVFECWLHPSKYCTQLCKEAAACSRTVCFFAHTLAELRPAPEEEAPSAPMPSRRISSSNLQADDSWMSTRTEPSRVRHPLRTNGRAGCSGNSAWPPSTNQLSPASVEAVTGAMADRFKLHSSSPPPCVAQTSSKMPAGMGIMTTTPFFTPPVSPGCGLTPSYSPASPQHSTTSPLTQRLSRLSTGSAQARPRSYTQQPCGLPETAALPQLIACMSPEQLALNSLRRPGVQQHTSQQQQQKMRQQESTLHPPRPFPSLSARQLNVHTMVRPPAGPQSNHQVPAHWGSRSDPSGQGTVLDLPGLAQLASTLLSDPSHVQPHMPLGPGWGMSVEPSASYMPSGALDGSGLSMAAGSPQTFTMPSSSWAQDVHGNFVAQVVQPDMLLQPPGGYNSHQR